MKYKTSKRVTEMAEEMDSYLKKVYGGIKLHSVLLVGSAILIGILIVLGGLWLGFMQMSKWYDRYRVRFQPAFQWPVVVEIREDKNAGQSAQIDLSPLINTLYRRVRNMESGSGMSTAVGIHTYCQKKGMVNETGYLLTDTYCFRNYGEEWAKFKELFEARLQEMTVDEALCYWNTGVKQPMCTYSNKYRVLYKSL